MNRLHTRNCRIMTIASVVAALGLFLAACSEPTGYEGQQDTGEPSPDTEVPPPDTDDNGDTGDEDEGDTGDEEDAADTGPADVVVTLSFDGAQASDISLDAGEDLPVSWTSTGADQCSPTGTIDAWTDLAGSTFGTSGNADVTISSSGELGISCEGAGGVTEVGPFLIEAASFDCDDVALPGDWQRVTVGCHLDNPGRECTELLGEDGVFGGSSFPPSSVTRLLGITGNNQGKRYLAMRFDTGDIADDDFDVISIAEPQGDANTTNAMKFITFSKCPGNFDRDAVIEEMGSDGCFARTLAQNMGWGGPSTNPATVCQLQPNQTYYMNIVYTQDPEGTPPEDLQPHPDCLTAVCANRYQW